MTLKITFPILSLILLSFSISAFELVIDKGVNESMAELVLSHVPANATIGLKKIHVHADGCKSLVCRYSEWKGNNEILGTYTILVSSHITRNLKAKIDLYYGTTYLSDIELFYQVIEHELGHHNDARINGFRFNWFDFNMLKQGEAYRSDPGEIYANNFRLLPKCGCSIDDFYIELHNHDGLGYPFSSHPILSSQPAHGALSPSDAVKLEGGVLFISPLSIFSYRFMGAT